MPASMIFSAAASGRSFVRCLGTGLQGSSLVMRPTAPRGFLAGYAV